MRNRLLATAGIVTIMLFGSALGGYFWHVSRADASRNSAGTYSLATSPVTTLQTISTSLWNNTFNDLATGVTDSLDRNGRGGMLAALRGIDGTVAAPAFSFTSETGSGLFRNGASDVRMSISGTSKTFWNATGFGVGGAAAKLFHVQSGSSGATSAANTVALIESSGSPILSLLAPNAGNEALCLGDVANSCRGAIQYFNSADGSADQMQFQTNSTVRGKWSNSGFTIGSAGTAIGAIYSGSSALTPAAVAGQTCDTGTNAITVTGAVTGDGCMGVSANGFVPVNLSVTCLVSAANTVRLIFCNPTAGNVTPSATTYKVWVIH